MDVHKLMGGNGLDQKGLISVAASDSVEIVTSDFAVAVVAEKRNPGTHRTTCLQRVQDAAPKS